MRIAWATFSGVSGIGSGMGRGGRPTDRRGAATGGLGLVSAIPTLPYLGAAMAACWTA